MTLGSRAVERSVVPGSLAFCNECGQHLRFSTRARQRIVLCNVYEGESWNRIEHFHAACYVDADEPYGKPTPR